MSYKKPSSELEGRILLFVRKSLFYPPQIGLDPLDADHLAFHFDWSVWSAIGPPQQNVETTSRIYHVGQLATPPAPASSIADLMPSSTVTYLLPFIPANSWATKMESAIHALAKANILPTKLHKPFAP
jgi:hypothetical protein